MNEEKEEILIFLISIFVCLFGGVFMLVLLIKWMVWLMDLFNLI